MGSAHSKNPSGPSVGTGQACTGRLGCASRSTSSGNAANTEGSTMAASHGNVIVCNSAETFEKQYEAARASGRVVVIDFTASWCGPCQLIAPLFAELSAKYPNLVFLKVDVDEAPTVSKAYNVTSMPTFVFIDANGQELYRFSGANKTELEKRVKLYSGKSAVAN